MSTSSEIATQALRRLGVYPAGEAISAEDLSDAETALDHMLASWEAYGVDVDADIPLPAKHQPAIVAMLAVRLSEDYGMTAGPVLSRDADAGWRMLQAEYITAPDASFDLGSVRTSGRALVTD